MSLTVDDVQKMKVVELRAELTSRGLDTRGIKAVLVDRLLDAVALESGTNGSAIVKPKPTIIAGDDDTGEDEEESTTGQESPRRATRGQVLPESPKKTPGSPTKTAPAVVAVPATSPVKAVISPQKPAVVPVPATSPVKTVTSPQKPVPQSVVQPAPVVSPVKVSPSPPVAVATSPVASTVSSTTTAPANPTAGSPVKSTAAPLAVSPVAAAISTTVPIAVSAAAPAAVVSLAKPAVEVVDQTTKPNESEVKSSEDVNDGAQSEASQVKVEPMDTEDSVVSSSQNQDGEPKADQIETATESLKRKHEENGEPEDTNAKNQKKGNNANVKKLRTEEDYKARILPDDEPEYDAALVLLDWYKSDLNLKISKDGFLKAEPIIFEDFPWAYAGAKATHGFTSGKLAYEVKWLDNCEVKFDFGKVEVKHILRLGWSDLYTDLQLGEEKFSYGYDSQGKFFNGGETVDLEDATFEKGDVISSYLNLESDPVEISFAKNGVVVGSTIQIPKEEVQGKIWFPHILARNTNFEVNFGATEPAHPSLETFEFVGKIESSESKVAGPARPASKSECDFVMLCGMACCGKTKWAKEHKSQNLDKHFNILGTSTVAERALKKTTLGGADTPKSYDSFLMKAGRFVERLVDMAPARRRNYVLDQSNVLPNVQRRKAAGFEGFKRRAVVILPNDEEYQTRIKAREQEQGKNVPKSTLLDMKATFRLPEVGDTFSEVEFPELKKEEAVELVKKYNKEGIDAGYGQRNTSARGGGGFRGRGGGRGGPPRGGGFFRGGRGGSGGWRGGPPPPRGGGFRGMPRGIGGPPPRVLRDASRGGGFPSRGGPPRFSRGIPSLIGTRRNDAPRGMPGPRGGGGSWGRGGGGPSNGFQRGGRGGGGGGGGYSGFRGNPGGMGGRFGAPANMGMGGRPQPSPWASQPQTGGWARGGGSSGYGGNQGGGQYTDPWAQQVPDQGYGQSWDNSAAVQRNAGGGGGGTWQGYGGQTYGGYGYGRK